MLNAYWSNLNQLLKIPKLNDDEASRSARLLWQILIVTNVLNFVLFLIFSIMIPEEFWVTFFVSGSIFVSSFVTLCVLHRKNHVWAANIFCITTLLVFYVNAYLYSGIQNVNVMPFFILLIMCGLLLGRKGLIGYTAVILIAILSLYLLEIYGLLETGYDQLSSTEDIVMLLGILTLCSLLLYTALNSIDKAYDKIKNALAELRKTTVSKQYLDNIIESIDDMLFVFDNSYKIKRINMAVAQQLNYSEDQLIGKSFTKFLPHPTILTQALSAWEDMSTPIHMDSRLILLNGKEIEASLTISTIPGKKNTSIDYVCIANDITARKETERALREAVISAEEAAASKTEFLASMSHEIRTPLNAVLGMSSLLALTELNKEQADYLNTIQTSGGLLLEIIGNILDYSKIESDMVQLENKPFHVLECINGVIDIVQEISNQKGLTLHKVIDQSVPDFVSGDLYRLQQILINLLNNAIKFTYSGGVTLEVYGRKLDTKHELRFKVIDTGVGIPENRIDSIFEPFHQADSSTTRMFGGSGLGLAICKRLVHLMNGRFKVESAINSGSIFQFTAVLDSYVPANQTTPTITVEESIPNRFNILVTDDNKINVKVSSKMLTRLGHTVDAAYSGFEAITAVKTNKYDVIFMDIQMPEMDGIETTRQIKSLLTQENCPPIIALTANALPGDKENYLAAGLDGYLSKPIKLDTLKETLDSFLLKKVE